MSTHRAQHLLTELLSMTESERAEVVAELLVSLKPPVGAVEDDPAFRAEVDRRADRVRRGESDGLAWEDVRARLRVR